jgi:hypothetical protein
MKASHLLGVCAAAVLLGPAARAQQLKAGDWQPMFDGKSLAGWKETAFAGQGKVTVEDGKLVLGAGAPLTGVNWEGRFPTLDFEIRFEAARLQGGDFFASLTFPYKDSHATWVTGGWGGDIVGISNVDGWDASDNETRTYFEFEAGKWYSFRLRVTDGRMAAWIDDRQVVGLEINGRTISMRTGEIGLSRPFGFASYNTRGALRKIEYRVLSTAGQK